MGEVYKARDTRLERTVAIKILPETLAADPQFRERFDREARAVAALNHPHICTLHDVGSQDGIAFLVMEHVEGETLAARLEKGALPLDQALKTAIEIASALDKAHRAGITHRDLKPGNIMVTKGGAKLLDFGLAKVNTATAAGAGLSMLATTPPNVTTQGTILGTFQYMAPEQLEGQEADARTLTGAPVAIFDDVMQAINALDARDETGAGQFTVSTSGTLMYVLGGAFPDRQAEFMWVDRKGVVTPLPQLPRGNYFFPRISPDGQRIAYGARRTQTPNSDLWVYDISRQNTTRLTSQGSQTMPVWSPDGKSLVFVTRTPDGTNIARMPADGSGTPERLTTSSFARYPTSWSAGTNTIAFGENHGIRGHAWTLPMDGQGQPKSVLDVPVNQSPQPALSPNGEWLAYHSAETGSDEVYIQAYPGPGQKIRISADGGGSVVWGRSGRELFYLRPGPPAARVGTEAVQLIAVDIDTSNGIRVGKPRLLFEGPYQAAPTAPAYDVAPDGQRFLMDRPTYFDTPVTEMHIVLNYLK